MKPQARSQVFRISSALLAMAPLLLNSVLVSCSRFRQGTQATSAAQPTPTASTTEELTPAEIAMVDASVPEVKAGPWLDSIRARKWDEANERLEALPDETKNRPEMKYARARVATFRSDYANATKLFENLEKDLPLLSTTILRHRANAELNNGMLDKAAHYFEQQKNAKSLIKLALAFEKANRPDDTYRMAEKAVNVAHGASDEAEAKIIRARCAKTPQSVALADYRWVALHSAGSQHGITATEQLNKLNAANFSEDETIDRAKALADAGKTELALAEVNKVQAKPGKKQHALGGVYYRLKQWKKASEAFDSAVQEGSPDPAHDAFHAARALSRANDDNEAIRRYQEFIKKYPKTTWSDEAAFLIGRLHMLLGHTDEAARGYESFLKHHSKGKHVEEATYELGLVRLQQSKPKKARDLFADLVSRADSKLELAHYRELEGVAAQQAGEKADAIKIFQSVIKDQPLSWPALVSKTRLTQLGAEIPAPIVVSDISAPARLDVKLPAQVNLLHQLGFDDEAEEALHKSEPLFSGFAPRDKEAVCEAYSQLEGAKYRFRFAQDKIKADEYLQRAPGPSNLWAWGCFFPTPYKDQVTTAAKREEISANLIWSIMRQESAFNAEVRSPANAYGLLQLLPKTAKGVAEKAGIAFEDGSLTNPIVNIDLGIRYEAWLVRMWKGNLPLAIASYNAGPNAVSRWLEHGDNLDIDLWVARIPYGETRTYVMRVMGNLARYSYLEGGANAVPQVSLTIEQGMRAEPGAF